jgi:hypothetical protein
MPRGDGRKSHKKNSDFESCYKSLDLELTPNVIIPDISGRTVKSVGK